MAFIAASALLIGYRGNQPMQVPGAPKGITYFQFMADRFDAAKTVKPSRCGTGMIGSLFALGPIYATFYSHVALHPHGFLVKVTAPDLDMPKLGPKFIGMKLQGSGGIPLNDCPGQCWQNDIKDAISGRF